jgi:addiction module RelB/DinJ family antitoxin
MMATLTINMDNDLKRSFMEFCKEIGLNASATMSMFAKKVVREQRIPFEITAINNRTDTKEGVDTAAFGHALDAMNEYHDMFVELAK